MSLYLKPSLTAFVIGSDPELGLHLAASGIRVLGQVAEADLFFPLARQCRPDLIILTARSPLTPGEEAAETVARLHILAPGSELAVITGGPHADLTAAGATYVFPEPFDCRELISQLKPRPAQENPEATPPEPLRLTPEGKVVSPENPALSHLREQSWRQLTEGGDDNRIPPSLPARSGPVSMRRETMVVMGAKGGVGATFLTVNLAVALAGLAGRRTLLLDFSRTGDTDIYLNLPEGISLAEMLPRMTAGTAISFEEGITVHEPSGLRVLTGSPRAELFDLFTREQVEHLISHAQEAFDCLVVDTPTPPEERILPCLWAATKIILVTTPGVAALRQAALRKSWLAQQGIGEERLALVVNRVVEGFPFPLADLKRTTGLIPAALLPEDRDAAHSLLRGRPLVLTTPDHPISRSIQHLAYGYHPSPARGFKPTLPGFLARWNRNGRDRR